MNTELAEPVDIWRTVHSVIDQTEREWLVALASDVCTIFEQPTFVNIGVSWGCSMHCLRAGCASARLIGIDIRNRQAVAQDALRAELIIADSHVYHTKFDEPIHLLFIDGHHSLAGVTADLAGWTPKVVDRVVLHDYGGSQPPHCQVKAAVDAWLMKERDCWENIPAVGSMIALRRTFNRKE